MANIVATFIQKQLLGGDKDLSRLRGGCPRARQVAIGVPKGLPPNSEGQKSPITPSLLAIVVLARSLIFLVLFVLLPLLFSEFISAVDPQPRQTLDNLGPNNITAKVLFLKES
jgi:hypothetical protein